MSTLRVLSIRVKADFDLGALLVSELFACTDSRKGCFVRCHISTAQACIKFSRGWPMALFLIPQTVCPHYGVLTVGVRSGVHRGVHFRPWLSSAQARTEFRLRRQYRTDRGAWDFGSVYTGCPCTQNLDLNLHGRCRGSDGIGGSKPEFTWQVQGPRNQTLCENRGRRSILWTLPKRWQACVIRRIAFTWQAQGICTMDPVF